MGILNTSPESFFDGENVKITQDYVLNKAQNLVAEGAEIIDIGGQSTRPGYTEISAEEEIARTAPFIKLIKQKIKARVSIDSYKAPVVKTALEAGADIVNDVSGLKDENLAKLAASYSDGIILSSGNVQGEILDYCKGLSIPLLPYNAASYEDGTWIDEYNSFYDGI